MPHPDSWFIQWLGEQKLLTRDLVVEYQRKLEEALRDLQSFDAPIPTLGGLLERDGHLTREQREAGEREAGRRRGEFANWRSKTLSEQQRRPPPGAT